MNFTVYKTSDAYETEPVIIEIETLEDLLKFSKETGQMIILHGYDGESIPHLEVYDDYRE